MARSSTSFKKRQSGNPGGRPRVVAEVRDLAREHTERAVGTLVEIMEDRGKPAAARVSAAVELLNRGYGRAPQSFEIRGTLEKQITDLVMSLDEAEVEKATKH